MPRSKGRTGRPWRRVRAQVIAASNGVCAICGVLGPRPDCPRCAGSGVTPHGFECPRCRPSVDHIVELSKGGDPLDPDNLRAAHTTPCNTHRDWLAAQQPSAPRRSQAW